MKTEEQVAAERDTIKQWLDEPQPRRRQSDVLMLTAKLQALEWVLDVPDPFEELDEEPEPTATLAARVGNGTVEHAVVLAGDPEEVRLTAQRGGHRRITTVCGKAGEARGREFNRESGLACRTCVARTSDAV